MWTTRSRRPFRFDHIDPQRQRHLLCAAKNLAYFQAVMYALRDRLNVDFSTSVLFSLRFSPTSSASPGRPELLRSDPACGGSRRDRTGSGCPSAPADWQQLDRVGTRVPRSDRPVRRGGNPRCLGADRCERSRAVGRLLSEVSGVARTDCGAGRSGRFGSPSWKPSSHSVRGGVQVQSALRGSARLTIRHPGDIVRDGANGREAGVRSVEYQAGQESRRAGARSAGDS